jgi:hypothetical protein
MKRFDFIRYRFNQTRKDQFMRFAAGCERDKPFTLDHLMEKRELFDLDWIFDGIKYQIQRQMWTPEPNFLWSNYSIHVKLEEGVVRVHNGYHLEYFDIPIINFYRGLV